MGASAAFQRDFDPFEEKGRDLNRMRRALTSLSSLFAPLFLSLIFPQRSFLLLLPRPPFQRALFRQSGHVRKGETDEKVYAVSFADVS